MDHHRYHDIYVYSRVYVENTHTEYAYENSGVVYWLEQVLKTVRIVNCIKKCVAATV